MSSLQQIAPEWQETVDQIARDTGLHSVLIMQSLDHSMRVVCANRSQDIYHAGDEGPKSVQPGCHELYCERVVNTGEPLFVADAALDDDWKDNEDLVKFGLGVYYGLPIYQADKVVGTACALNPEPFDFSAGNPSAIQQLQALQEAIEAKLNA